jgi:sigma-B regulation protein RsbU (phosphoserine phosphatase)
MQPDLSYLDKAPCIYISAKDDGTIVDVNENTCTTLGYTKEQLLSAKLDSIFTLATRIFQQTHLFPLLKMQSTAAELFITLQTKGNDHVPVLLNAERKIINEAAVNTYIGIVVLNRKKFEDELVAAKKAAESALHENSALIQAKEELQAHAEQLDQQMQVVNKQNEELKQFNRVVTHDLQEPLRKLSVFTNMLQEKKEGESDKVILQKILNVSARMRSIVSGLQQYVWLTETQKKLDEVHLDKLLLITLQQLKKTYPGVDINLEWDGLIPFLADHEQVSLLFYHLLSNSIRFRKEENKVNVLVSNTISSRNKFENIPGRYFYTDYLKLKIKDDGMGFDPQYSEQVFELFKRLSAKSGHGIGLSLCKKIADNHNGKISIFSKEGEGTTVTVLLPLLNVEAKKKEILQPV